MSEVDIYKGIAKNMSEERLKEIKDYADFEMKLVLNEEKYIDVKLIKELYNEVIKLREENSQLDDIRNANYLSWQDSVAIIKKAIEWINEYYGSYYAECGKGKEDLLNILRGENNE